MNNKVKLRKNQLDYFRKLARESSLEIQAYLVGDIVNPNITVVDHFVYPPEYGLQTRYQAAWYRRDYERVRREAEERGRRIIGSIHSHPGMDDAVLSPEDYESCIAEGHRICGIVTTDGSASRVRFWVMDCALPADVSYEKGKATPARPERIVKEIKTTPSRAILAEHILMVIDSMDEETPRRYQIGTLSHAGGPKLVDLFFSLISREPDRPVKPTLRNYLNTRSESHQATQNRLQRDTRSHPNARLTLEVASLWQDSTTLHERIFYDTLYLATCMDARGHIRLVGLEEEPIKEPHYTNADKAIGEELGGFNKFFMSIKGGSPDETSNQG